MQVVLLYNKSNTFGLRKDVEIVEKLLRDKVKNVSIRVADPLEPPTPSDVAIHFEVPIYGFLPWAKTNYLLCNPEWYEEAWNPYLTRFNGVLFRSYSVREEFRAKNPSVKTFLLNWSALTTPISDAPQSNEPSHGFIWFLGGS